RLKLHNPAYRTIWGLSDIDLEGEPHISDLVEATRSYYDDGGDWPAMRQQIIANITAQEPTNGLLDRRDGSVLQLATVPLPDGNVLVTCLDVTDTARVERVLRERNEALETAGRLDIRARLQAVITLTRERARNRDLALTLRCPREIGTIEADERRLKQALFNLISNAIKFTPAGGSIRLEARRSSGELILAVTD